MCDGLKKTCLHAVHIPDVFQPLLNEHVRLFCICFNHNLDLIRCVLQPLRHWMPAPRQSIFVPNDCFKPCGKILFKFLCGSKKHCRDSSQRARSPLVKRKCSVVQLRLAAKPGSAVPTLHRLNKILWAKRGSIRTGLGLLISIKAKSAQKAPSAKQVPATNQAAFMRERSCENQKTGRTAKKNDISFLQFLLLKNIRILKARAQVFR